MPTTNQLIRKGRKKQKNKSKTPALEGCPQKRGTVTWTGIMNPKKPNSADRKVCRVRLSTGRSVLAYIPGEGHMIGEHASVLIRGGRVPDLPGVRYKVIRKARGSDDPGEHRPHHQRRSKYGVKIRDLDRTTATT